MAEPDNRKGTLYLVGAISVFAAQDGISRHLGASYNVFSIVMLRYWVFVLFGLWLMWKVHGGLSKGLLVTNWRLQTLRGVLLAAEICVMQVAFVKLGLIESHAVFVTSPLMVAALSGPILGEKVGWRRWMAIGFGCVGVLFILKPGGGVFSLWSLVPLLGAFLYALYGLLTRLAGRTSSSAASFFWMAVVGAIAMTLPGILLWRPMTPEDSLWMATLCCSGVLGHYLLIRSYEVAEASALQPFAYLQLVLIAVFGITIFGEVLRWNVALGAVIVVAAGLFTWWRQQMRARKAAIAPTIPR